MARETREQAFGRALAAARRAAGLTQTGLSEVVGWKQPTISAWENGEAEPPAETVFELERVFKLKPGALSKFLGYLPVAAVKVAGAFEDAIAGDPYLDDADKRFLLNAYKLAIRDRGATRRGSQKG